MQLPIQRHLLKTSDKYSLTPALSAVLTEFASLQFLDSSVTEALLKAIKAIPEHKHSTFPPVFIETLCCLLEVDDG